MEVPGQRSPSSKGLPPVSTIGESTNHESGGVVKRTDKQDQIDSIRNQFDRASFCAVAEYKGLSVAQLSSLRSELRKVDGQFRVVRNTLARRALDGHTSVDLSGHLLGPVGVVFAYGDPAAAAKVLREFAKGAEAFVVTAGVIEGSVIDAAGVRGIADLPSREVLVARMLGAMNSPIAGLANVLAGTVRQLVYALSAVAEKKAA